MAPWILGIVCFIGSGLQALGFIGVARASHIGCYSVPLHSTGILVGKAHHVPQISYAPYLDHDRSILYSFGLDHHVRHSPFDGPITM